MGRPEGDLYELSSNKEWAGQHDAEGDLYELLPNKEWTGQHDAEGDLYEPDSRGREGRAGTYDVAKNGSCLFLLQVHLRLGLEGTTYLEGREGERVKRPHPQPLKPHLLGATP